MTKVDINLCPSVWQPEILAVDPNLQCVLEINLKNNKKNVDFSLKLKTIPCHCPWQQFSISQSLLCEQKLNGCSQITDGEVDRLRQECAEVNREFDSVKTNITQVEKEIGRLQRDILAKGMINNNDNNNNNNNNNDNKNDFI